MESLVFVFIAHSCSAANLPVEYIYLDILAGNHEFHNNYLLILKDLLKFKVFNFRRQPSSKYKKIYSI